MNPLQTRIDSIEERLARIEKIVLEGKYLSGKRNDIERLVIEKIDAIPMQHLVVISLYLTPKQTKEEISNVLYDWGIDFGTWFQRHHFENMLKKKLIKKYKDDKNKYSLSVKGENIADKIIEQLISGKKLKLQKI